MNEERSSPGVIVSNDTTDGNDERVAVGMCTSVGASRSGTGGWS